MLPFACLQGLPKGFLLLRLPAYKDRFSASAFPSENRLSMNYETAFRPFAKESRFKGFPSCGNFFKGFRFPSNSVSCFSGFGKGYFSGFFAFSASFRAFSPAFLSASLWASSFAFLSASASAFRFASICRAIASAFGISTYFPPFAFS